MKCKKHTSDLSSTVGVCASCLRERLIALVAARVISRASDEYSRNSDPNLDRRADGATVGDLRHHGEASETYPLPDGD